MCEAASEFDQSARVELSFKGYIFALLKLFKRTSRGAYSLANTAAIRPFFEREDVIAVFGDLMMASNLGRVVGSRQDCVFESAWKTFSLLHALPTYCADGIVSTANETGQILRTSLLVRGSCPFFMSKHWFHAVAWDMILEALRVTMGTDVDGEDYLVCAPFFDEIYELAEKLQTDPELLIRQMKADPSSSLFYFSDRWKTPVMVEWLENRGEKLGYSVATQQPIEGTSIQDHVRTMPVDYYYGDAGWADEKATEEDKVASAAAAKKYMNECFVDLVKALIISLEKSCEDVLSKTNGVYSVLCVTDAMKVYVALRTKKKTIVNNLLQL